MIFLKDGVFGKVKFWNCLFNWRDWFL